MEQGDRGLGKKFLEMEKTGGEIGDTGS
jgi:hypothetical protein